MKVYAFDVDDTLTVSHGPIGFHDLLALRDGGDVVGICGNWARVTLQVKGWQLIFSFLGPLGLSKAEFLRQISLYVPADEYILVGNDPAVLPIDRMFVSDDIGAARDANWRFIKENDFAAGAR